MLNNVLPTMYEAINAKYTDEDFFMYKNDNNIYLPLPPKFKWIHCLELNGVKYYNSNYVGRS